MLLLIAWTLGSVLSLLQQGSPPAGLLLAAGLLGFGIVIAAIVLGILGLIDYAQKRELYTQGRAQAIWSLVLCGVFMMAFIVGLLRGATGVVQSRTQPLTGQTLKFPEFNFQFSTPGTPWVQLDAAKLNRFSKLAFVRSRPKRLFHRHRGRTGPVPSQ
jgi:hypothetical protein